METSKRIRISSGSIFEEKVGYSRAICDGRWIFVAGTTGFNYDTMEISASVTDQCRRTLDNIAKVLIEAGSSLDDVVRVNYIFPDPDDFKSCWPILSECFGQVRPASTMISASLADPRMKVEIEVTALRSSGSAALPSRADAAE